MRGDRPVRRHARVEVRSARGAVRRRRRAERVARARARGVAGRPGARRRCSSRSSAICSRSARGSPIRRIRSRTASPRRRSTDEDISRLEQLDRSARSRSCRRCAGSSSPADRRPAPRCTSRAPSAAAPSARWSRSAAEAVRAGAARLRQPPVGPAVRHGARGQPPRRSARDRMVKAGRSGPGDGLAGGLRLLRAARARALRELSGRVASCCRRPCGRTSRPSTPSRAAPTTSPTNRDRADADRLAAARRLGARRLARGRRIRHPPRDDGARSDLRRARQHDSTRVGCRVSLLHDLLSAFRQDVTTTRYETWA